MQFKRIAALIAAAFLLTSCGKTEGSVFEYQKGIVSASFTVETEKGIFGVVLEKGNDESALSLTSPADLEGTKFILEGDGIHVVSDDTDILLNHPSAMSLVPLCEMFSLSEADVSGITKNGDGATVVTAKKGTATYRLVFGKDGKPDSVRISGSRNLSVGDIDIKYGK